MSNVEHQQDSQHDDDAIRVTRPPGIDDGPWTTMRAAITEHIDRLVDEVRGERSTAAHSWREFMTRSPYSRALALEEADRDDLGDSIGDEQLQMRVAGDPTIGGLLMWEGDAGADGPREGGYLIMLTGQSVEQEHQVMENAEWLVSCGCVYEPDRVGWRAKDAADRHVVRGTVDQYIWLLWNDRDHASMVR